MEEILRSLIDDLGVIPDGHEPGDCPRALSGVCDTCDFCYIVQEAVAKAEDQLARLRLGVPTAA